MIHCFSGTQSAPSGNSSLQGRWQYPVNGPISVNGASTNTVFVVAGMIFANEFEVNFKIHRVFRLFGVFSKEIIKLYFVLSF